MLNDYLTFRKMITTAFIQLFFWLGVAAVVIMALVTMADSFFGGLIILIFGPLVVRIYAELLIVIFRINETLTDIRTLLKNQEEKDKRGMM